ncbi:AraC family transcriptional regulator [Ramlibacter sp. AW1]|uniref:AraC family transcriptional regulator n=1 Tax=Ramlibacter aurantiacus TaxID=2801330 RepID=A0A936ZMW7_9BURK|nr:AraC family transcriptional regulator [Ramlibacter aurantiacus]MBL0419141.1 AraC family transcriptional regulator [Ramlibacter aurantiacus]
MDMLSRLLSRFAISAGVFYTGRICGVHPFASDAHRGHLHLIQSGPVDLVDDHGHSRRIDAPSLIFMPRPERHSLIADESGGAKVLCATVQFGGGDNRNPISESLPAVVLVPLAELEGSSAVLELVAAEAFHDQPGANAAVDRLCEVLIIKLLRHCLRAGITHGGMLAGLSDPRLSKALAAVHGDPMQAWTLVALAREAGMSRARFAAHFHQVIGVTPADYLASWRISIAQKLLRGGRPIKQVCGESGYGSSSALTRAFIRKVGVPPTEWLRKLEADQPPVQDERPAEPTRH